MAYYVMLQPCCYHECWYYSQYFENKASFLLCSPRRKQRQIGEIRHLGNEERALCVYLWILYLLYFYFVRVDSFFLLMYLQVYCSVYLKHLCISLQQGLPDEKCGCIHFEYNCPQLLIPQVEIPLELWLVNLEGSAVKWRRHRCQRIE